MTKDPDLKGKLAILPRISGKFTLVVITLDPAKFINQEITGMTSDPRNAIEIDTYGKAEKVITKNKQKLLEILAEAHNT